MFEGILKKMKTHYDSPITYYLVLENDFLIMNQFVEKKISISHVGYECLNCSQPHEIFNQGFCKKCFFKVPQAGQWVIYPEKSKAHLAIEDRNLAYEQVMQLQPHIVYLANSGGLKVGVTRLSQLPTRWIDQGAEQAIVIAQTTNRYEAGVIEVELKKHISDKTNWRKMLTFSSQPVHLELIKQTLKSYFPTSLLSYWIEESQPYELNFPVKFYPEKVISLNLKKQSEYTGTLIGIKGQYWLFDDGAVFNVRSHEGFKVQIS